MPILLSVSVPRFAHLKSLLLKLLGFFLDCPIILMIVLHSLSTLNGKLTNETPVGLLCGLMKLL